MASIIDWLVLPEALKPFFVVNNAVATVAVTVPANPFLEKIGGSVRAFQAADGVMIREYGIKMPECFEWTARAGQRLPSFDLGWARAFDGANLTIQASSFAVPIPNEIIDLKGSQSEGFYLSHYSILQPDPGENGKLYWGMSPMTVSMVGVPDSLNGTTQYIEPFVKVQHQLDMVVP